ncbi:holin [Carnobacterium gallinarum]|uniref:holin n=1 Tax=Carnobacterium gallinarum TaxID=2749 RepID=UPI0005565301|nr:holin [Carnobacterium gallinarum]
MNGFELVLTIISNMHLVIATITILVIQAIKMMEKVDTKLLPILSLVTGGLIGAIVSIAGNADFTQSIALGIISGAIASGIFDALSASNNLLGNWIKKNSTIGKDDK